MKCCGFAVKFQDRITFVFIYDFFFKGLGFQGKIRVSNEVFRPGLLFEYRVRVSSLC